MRHLGGGQSLRHRGGKRKRAPDDHPRASTAGRRFGGCRYPRCRSATRSYAAAASVSWLPASPMTAEGQILEQARLEREAVLIAISEPSELARSASSAAWVEPQEASARIHRYSSSREAGQRRNDDPAPDRAPRRNCRCAAGARRNSRRTVRLQAISMDTSELLAADCSLPRPAASRTSAARARPCAQRDTARTFRTMRFSSRSISAGRATLGSACTVRMAVRTAWSTQARARHYLLQLPGTDVAAHLFGGISDAPVEHLGARRLLRLEVGEADRDGGRLKFICVGDERRQPESRHRGQCDVPAVVDRFHDFSPYEGVWIVFEGHVERVDAVVLSTRRHKTYNRRPATGDFMWRSVYARCSSAICCFVGCCPRRSIRLRDSAYAAATSPMP